MKAKWKRIWTVVTNRVANGTVKNNQSAKGLTKCVTTFNWVTVWIRSEWIINARCLGAKQYTLEMCLKSGTNPLLKKVRCRYENIHQVSCHLYFAEWTTNDSVLTWIHNLLDILIFKLSDQWFRSWKKMTFSFSMREGLAVFSLWGKIREDLSQKAFFVLGYKQHFHLFV